MMPHREITARAMLSIEDSGARAWQRGASRWDNGFMEHEHFAAAWLRGWLRAFAEFSLVGG